MSLVTLEEALPQARDPSWRAGLDREFRRGWEMEKANRMARVVEMKKVEAIKNRKSIDGIGQRVGEIDVRTFFRWEQEDDGHFWDDRKNVTKFLNDNDEYKPGKHG